MPTTRLRFGAFMTHSGPRWNIVRSLRRRSQGVRAAREAEHLCCLEIDD
jgi:hypothetical protein